MPGQNGSAANAPQVAQIEIKVNGSDLTNAIMDKLAEVEVENSLYLPSMFSIRLYDDDSTTLIDGSTFPQGGAVQISFKSRTFYTVAFIGEITALEPDFTPDSVPMLVVRGYDRSHRLHRGTKNKVFVQSTDGDIVTQIANAAGLVARVEATTIVHTHVFQFGVSDWAFIHERARRNGYEVLIDDRTLYFRKATTTSSEVTLTWSVDLSHFRPRYTLAKQVNKVTVKGWDPQTKQAIVGQATSSPAPAVGIGGWGGGLAQSAFAEAEVLEVRHPVETQSEAEKMAQAILDEINAGFLQADGIALGNPDLKPGVKVNIQKVGTKFSGKYIVTTSRHTYNPTEGYLTAFTVQGARAQTMADLIDQSMIEQRSTQMWGGIVTALVTNNNDPNNMGRVKLKFPWLDDSLESNWARVAGVASGSSHGFMWLPEVNDEVIVAFEHGDFDYPYVIGSVWNGQDAPPESAAIADGKVVIRTMKTTAGHVIRLTETNSAKKIEIIDSTQQTSITMDETNKKITIDSKQDIAITAAGKLDITATNNITLSSTGGNVDIKASAGTASVKGNMFSAEGTSTAEVKSTGVTSVKGSIVNIN